MFFILLQKLFLLLRKSNLGFYIFYRGFFDNQKGSGTIFQATFFVEFFDKKDYFVILHKLAKFHYQTAFTSQFIQ